MEAIKKHSAVLKIDQLVRGCRAKIQDHAVDRQAVQMQDHANELNAFVDGLPAIPLGADKVVADVLTSFKTAWAKGEKQLAATFLQACLCILLHVCEEPCWVSRH